MVTVEQYLSLHQDSLSNTPNDAVSLRAELAGNNGDGDRRRRRQGEHPDRRVGPDQLSDDGPTIQPAVLEGEQQLPTLAVDESFLPNGSTPDPTLTVSTGDFSGAVSAQGADGATIAYRLGVLSPAWILVSLTRLAGRVCC